MGVGRCAGFVVVAREASSYRLELASWRVLNSAVN
jgi:hypothetical protein